VRYYSAAPERIELTTAALAVLWGAGILVSIEIADGRITWLIGRLVDAARPTSFGAESRRPLVT
jgi:hypothetical protein